MHEAYWGFKEPPFAQTPDPRFYYLGQAHEDALMMLHYGLSRNKGAVLLTGALGTGKTSLCHKLANFVDPAQIQSVTIVNPDLTPLQLLSELLAELGVTATSEDRHAITRDLHNKLREIYDQGKKVLLLIDDAHHIKDESTFEELRMLLNLETGDQFLINIVLAGVNELSHILAKYQELDQMFAVRERLQPLSVSDMTEMLLHRLRCAGYTGDTNLFDADATLELHRFTKGVPRMVCHLADHALMMGKLLKAKSVDGMLMHEAIEEFYGDEEDAA